MVEVNLQTTGKSQPLYQRLDAALTERTAQGLLRILKPRTALSTGAYAAQSPSVVSATNARGEQSPNDSINTGVRSEQTHGDSIDAVTAMSRAHSAKNRCDSTKNSHDSTENSHDSAESWNDSTENPHNLAENWRDLASNDYLRLSRHPRVIAAAVAATQKWGASSSASPLISGYTTAHHELEEHLCAWGDFPHALVWNTGYAANQAVLSTLPQRGDIVLADRLIHNSMITGLVRSGARLQRYRHCDTEHLETLLAQFTGDGRCVFVVTESVFSMDGDAPDMQRLAELKNRYGFFLIVDEAHALGWYGARGSGLLEHSATTAAADIVVGTLGKGLGSMGAFTLLRSERLRSYLINFAAEFIYSTYLPPSCACAATTAIAIVQEQGATERQRLHALSYAVRDALQGALQDTPQGTVQDTPRGTLQGVPQSTLQGVPRGAVQGVPRGDSPIVPLPIGSAEQTMRAAERLRTAGWAVGAVRPPTVPEGGSRLRLSLHAGLTHTHIAALAQAVKEALQ